MLEPRTLPDTFPKVRITHVYAEIDKFYYIFVSAIPEICQICQTQVSDKAIYLY